MLYAIIILAVTAALGIILANKVLRGQRAPWLLSILHALLGASGLTTLVITGMQSNWPSRVVGSTTLIVLTAIAGFYLASRHFRNADAPKGIVISHATAAIIGFLLLLSVFII